MITWKERNRLDTKIRLMLPESVILERKTAGPVLRMFAVLTDHVFVFLFILATYLFFLYLQNRIPWPAIAGLFETVMPFLMIVASFLYQWFYFIFFEGRFQGRTPGKMAMGLKTVSSDGKSLSLSQVFLRNLLRITDMIPGMAAGIGSMLSIPYYAIGVIVVFFTAPAFLRLGDLAAGTVVIREPFYRKPAFKGHARLHEGRLPAASFLRTLGDFMNRRAELSPVRRKEIALALIPFLKRAMYFSQEQLEKGKEDPEYLVYLSCLNYSIPGFEKTYRSTFSSREETS